MTQTRRATIVALSIAFAASATLLAMGRNAICTCGKVALWGPVGPTQSQMLFDWYSASHIVHGLLFYAVFWLVAQRWPIEWRFVAALLIEAAWEVAENTPWIIDRYRHATAALGYNGDSVLNSLSDLAMMALGFLAARKLPLSGAIALLVVLELVPLLVIRDNLALNVWMLLFPTDSVRLWQAGA